MIPIQEQWDFLEGEFLSSSISGALQHSPTYDNASKKNREKLQRVLRAKLCELAAKYSSDVAVTTEEHLKNIQELADHAKNHCEKFLQGGKLRLGVAAKALNLYLKYLWCEGKLKVPPPHCPFDHTVIYDLLRFEDNWTEVDDPATYLKWVKKAEELRDDAKCESLAEWELRGWNANSARR
jgi:hypothetical protein